jgi:signal transduction histidine kinase/ActR/RegA family two-component response regulator
MRKHYSNRLPEMHKLRFEYRIIAGYIIIGGIWIVFSDKILNYFVRDPDILTRIQTLKGWFYVVVTAILFYSLLKSHLAKIRNAEQKAIDSDRLKTAFLQNISHEIRTPMNSIVGFSELLKDKNPSETEKSEYLEMIGKSSDQLLNIVNEVLDISLIETGNISLIKKRVHLNKLMDELYLSYKPLIKNDISFLVIKGLADQLSVVLTDVIKVRQILNNLLNNAIKFTERGQIRFGYSLVNEELEFFIEDTGIGIDPYFHQKIFERFLKVGPEKIKLYEGVGLGLAICKGNIDLLKGRIWLESEAGKGSKFLFTLPYEPAYEEETVRIKETDSIKNLNELTILVAEDDEINYLYIKEIFRDTGAELIHAINGKEAVEICQNNNKIGIVLIDIKMPVMNGYEAIKQIREFRPDLPIIAQTAFALSNEMLKAFNAGSNEYISKPFKKEHLLALVKKYQPSDKQ